jgi:L-alanine-DL-glutamate epimerase-like enolase superfamily enzyme
MARIAREAYGRGIRQFQIKVGVDGDWTTDVARIRAVRDTVGPDPLVYADWNCGATKLTAIRVSDALGDVDIMLEQPCGSLEACSDVKTATGRAMKIDEGVHDQDSILRAHALGCLDVAAVKLSKFGGLSAARRARDLCEHLETMMVIEDTWGSDITTAALAHLAVATPSRFLLNTCDLSRYVGPRIDSKALRVDGCSLAPSERPGLGVQPDYAVLGEAAETFE